MNRAQHILEYIATRGWMAGQPTCTFLAAGEYNENYLLEADGKRFVFRINHGTQLGIENQIEYEFWVLQAVKDSGVTPQPYCYSLDGGNLGNGVLMMEYVEGRPLDYRTDLRQAAEIFARIHSLPANKELICQHNPLRDICKESQALLSRYPVVYYENVYSLLQQYHDTIMTESGAAKTALFSDETDCIVNTEVNSGNFIISEQRGCLVDWEKAVVSCRYQDLAHFLLPTTTLWKTDVRLGEKERQMFLNHYCDMLDEEIPLAVIIERTSLLERIILLRALSWCFMAYHEYQEQAKVLTDDRTLVTITSYLNEAECFLK